MLQFFCVMYWYNSQYHHLMKSSHSPCQPCVSIDILVTLAGYVMAANSQHLGLDNNYTLESEIWWASNSSNLNFIGNDLIFNETSLFDNLSNSTDDPQTPSSSSVPPPSFPSSGLHLAGILIISLACYLLIVFLLISLHSCSARQGLAAECCCLSESDTTCRDICSDLCATCSQCCSCRCSCSTSS